LSFTCVHSFFNFFLQFVAIEFVRLIYKSSEVRFLQNYITFTIFGSLLVLFPKEEIFH